MHLPEILDSALQLDPQHAYATVSLWLQVVVVTMWRVQTICFLERCPVVWMKLLPLQSFETVFTHTEQTMTGVMWVSAAAILTHM